MPRLELPAVIVTGYSAVGIDEEAGLPEGVHLGDLANDAALFDLFAALAAGAREQGLDLPAELAAEEMSDKDLDRLLESERPAIRGLVRETADRFGERLAAVVLRFLDWDYWRGTERVVIGGGLSETRIGHLAISAADGAVQAAAPGVEVKPIHHPADEAGLVGAVHLLPFEEICDYDGMLAVDLGGTKLRVGIVEIRNCGDGDLTDAAVWTKKVWKHRDAKRRSRGRIVQRMAGMLEKAVEKAGKRGFRLAPQIGISCPGVIDEQGFIRRGAQNLPGDWTGPDFSLGAEIAARIPRIGKRKTSPILCNDAVVQGLSELPFVGEVRQYGIFTVGTGLGNANFRRRRR